MATFISDGFVNDMLSDANDDLARGDASKAYAKADQIMGLLDAGTLISETPQVLVDKARAMRDRAALAAMLHTIVEDTDDGLDDLERAFFATSE
jgi:(p)ppGpp synthase/HD superfamily hydrolase